MKYKQLLFLAVINLASCSLFADEPDFIAIDRFMSFARSGGITEMTAFLDSGHNIDALDRDGVSALWHAADANNPLSVKWLLEQGADINAYQSTTVIDPTAFLLAGARGYDEVLRVLLPYKPDMSIVNRYGGNALIPAAEKGHLSTVKLLLEESDVDVNLVNNLGWTALLEVVILNEGESPYPQIVELLLKHGADKSIADREGVTALEHAQRKKQTAIIALLR